ncbi:transmembrane protein 223 [Neodiprion pinetum]|uniref:transmembrane protein 223 n=1 Tax=Neodiprion pinetum TaxID=441929 RepID=UPI001EDE7EB7|nr:transmembrane protein 223 [Neodiprion pinetum]
MLGCAIADGIFSKQSLLLRGQSVARQWTWPCVKGGSQAIRCKLTVPSLRLLGTFAPGFRFASFSRFSRSGGTPGPSFNQAREVQTNKPYEIPTNLSADAILYKNENRKLFKLLNIFAISQLIFWTYLAHFIYTMLKDAPVSKSQADNLPWWRSINFGEKKIRTILSVCTFLIGYAMFAFAWMHTLKSVKYLVLRKGGNKLTFITHTPFGGTRTRTVPLDKVCCKLNRAEAKVHLPIKVKGDMMHYILDIRGRFTNPKLFDFTAGLQRPI